MAVGDYVTPTSGAHAGKLGPWSTVVSAVGIEPRSTGMKSTFVVYGVMWLAVIACFAFGVSWAWWATLVFAIGSLWYVPIGTAISLVIAALLFVPAIRASFLR